MSDSITFQPIGIVHSEYIEPEGTPIQSGLNPDNKAIIIIENQFLEGLKDLEDFSHISVLYYFHKIKSPFKLQVKPFMDELKRGVFATRAPNRPNKIGISCVELYKIEGNNLHIQNHDLLNGTPILDIKPFIAEFSPVNVSKTGWLKQNKNKIKDSRDDGRFV